MRGGLQKEWDGLESAESYTSFQGHQSGLCSVVGQRTSKMSTLARTGGLERCHKVFAVYPEHSLRIICGAIFLATSTRLLRNS